MKQKICEAIQNKSVLNLFYDGHMRVVEPHAHGMSDAGKNVLRCFQIDGGSNSGKVLGWKLMKVNEIELLSITDRQFSKPRNGYSKGDQVMDLILCEL